VSSEAPPPSRATSMRFPVFREALPAKLLYTAVYINVRYFSSSSSSHHTTHTTKAERSAQELAQLFIGGVLSRRDQMCRINRNRHTHCSMYNYTCFLLFIRVSFFVYVGYCHGAIKCVG